MRSLEPAKNILLTGAGFTKTFGGFLAGEMWAAILNELRGVPYPSLRELMFDDKDLDYERVYDDVLRNRQLTPAEKDAFGRSMHGAYSRMNDLFTDPMRTAEFAAVFQAFVSWFCGVEERDLGFYFTLNQDLFVETFYTPRAGGSRLRLPGLSSPKWFKREPLSLLEEGIALPPSADEAASELWRKNPSRLVYIKLHGSLGWRSSDGSSVMVIGHSKSAQIQEEPLLRWYFELFKEVLAGGDHNLLIIGYGFRDEHINEAILKACRERGLRLFIISPKDPRAFLADEMGPANELWRFVHGYYTGTVKDFYNPSMAEPTPAGKALFRDLELPPWGQ